MAAGELYNVTGRQLLQLFHHTPTLTDFSRNHWNVESVTLSVFLYHLEFLLPPLKPGRTMLQSTRNNEKVKNSFS
jgi:hypothetical protein